MITQLTSNLLWTEGILIIAVLSVAAALAYLYYKPALVLVACAFLFSFYFFRSPERSCSERQTNERVIVCPADGKVVAVKYDKTNGLEGYPQRVSIFLSPLDVHVNWIPVDGVLEDIIYTPGKFLLAFLPKSSLLNEHNDIVIQPTHTPEGHNHTMKVRQIAGFVARRICTWVEPKQSVMTGQKYGMIKFGSRVDIFLPACARVEVSVGERVYGGQTVLGRWICH